MKSLARANIGHQWKLFLAAIIVLTLSGCLIYVAVGISAANFRNMSAYERNYNADLFVKSLNVETNRYPSLFDSNVIHDIATYPEVGRVGPFIRLSNYILLEKNGKPIQIPVDILDSGPDGLLVPKLFEEEAYRVLQVPGNIILSKSVAKKDNLQVGDVLVSSNRGDEYTIAGIMSGEMGLSSYGGRFSFNFISSATGEMLGANVIRAPISDRIYSLGIQLKPGLDRDAAKARIDYYLQPKGLHTILPHENASASSWKFIREDKTFQGFLVVGMFAVLIPLFIIVQTLRSAIMAQNEQFATLRALGVPPHHLISTAMEQALWVGVLGAGLAFCVMQLIKWRLFAFDIGMNVPGKIVLMVSVAIVGSALLAGLISLFAIFKTQPQELLR